MSHLMFRIQTRPQDDQIELVDYIEIIIIGKDMSWEMMRQCDRGITDAFVYIFP